MDRKAHISHKQCIFTFLCGTQLGELEAETLPAVHDVDSSPLDQDPVSEQEKRGLDSTSASEHTLLVMWKLRIVCLIL